jgi:hypothetical protein
MTSKTALDWNRELVEQLEFHWHGNLRPRLEGLTDDEYTWEPVPGCWSLRPRAEATSPMAAGGGDLVLDFAFPEPDPPPVTTIAWRIGHLIVGVFGARNAAHFGGPPADYPTYVWPATAKEALAALDDAYATWTAGASTLGEARLADEVGPAEGPWEHHPYAGLVLHINREVIHHGAEIALLRDLYRSTAGRAIS